MYVWCVEIEWECVLKLNATQMKSKIETKFACCDRICNILASIELQVLTRKS